jgi:hypothetical protein
LPPPIADRADRLPGASGCPQHTTKKCWKSWRRGRRPRLLTSARSAPSPARTCDEPKLWRCAVSVGKCDGPVAVRLARLTVQTLVSAGLRTAAGRACSNQIVDASDGCSAAFRNARHEADNEHEGCPTAAPVVLFPIASRLSPQQPRGRCCCFSWSSARSRSQSAGRASQYAPGGWGSVGGARPRFRGRSLSGGSGRAPRVDRRDRLVADAMARVVPERAIAFAGSGRPRECSPSTNEQHAGWACWVLLRRARRIVENCGRVGSSHGSANPLARGLTSWTSSARPMRSARLRRGCWAVSRATGARSSPFSGFEIRTRSSRLSRVAHQSECAVRARRPSHNDGTWASSSARTEFADGTSRTLQHVVAADRIVPSQALR